MDGIVLGSVEARKGLAEKLASCALVARYGPEEPFSIAYSLGDLEASMEKFLRDQLPKLVDPGVKGQKLEDLLIEIQEEFRHILYHIHDPMFFRLVEPTHEWLLVSDRGKQ